MATTIISSSNSSKTHAVPFQQKTDFRIISIQSKALQAIRQGMSVTPLFKPELRINLHSFIQDQLLIRTIADFIGAFLHEGVVTSARMKSYFENSDLLADIQALFSDSTPYLGFLYEACADVLNQIPPSTQIQTAIEGRIFTLKNALLAQHKPAVIHKSQQDHQLSPQSFSQIKKEGADFLRYFLALHLNAIKKRVETVSFQDSLTKTAEQLIPFVREITNMYFKEIGSDYAVRDVLTFRNCSGYNRHATVAAAVMEACLSSLGYKTRIMERTDLEPRVTLATTHSIVEVTGPDQSKYLVDPTYFQFHRDVLLEQGPPPAIPVLVLSESEVDDYIEKNIMVHWKTNFKHVQANNSSIIQKLSQQDQLISFEIKKYAPLLAKERVPSDVEEWVRKSFKRVWDLSTYTFPVCVRVFQEIFNDAWKVKNVFKYVENMHISSTASHLSYLEIERKLNQAQELDSAEILSLIAQLPDERHKNYFSLLDVDPRLKEGASVTLNAYFRSFKKVVNPDGKNLRVLYGCSGSDCTTILLATDSSDLTFVDTTVVSLAKFKKALKLLKNSTDASKEKISRMLDQDFFTGRYLFMGSVSDSTNGQHLMPHIELKILYELKQMGVDLNQAVFHSSGNGVKIDFSWQYHGAASSRRRSLTLITADITKPDNYPPILKKTLDTGIDIFYLKGACNVPELYPQFLPTIAQSISPGGWLMTTDTTTNMDVVDPEPSLKVHDLAFKRIPAEESSLLEPLIQVRLHPLTPVPTLDAFREDKRFRRAVGTGTAYWAILNLRQKN